MDELIDKGVALIVVVKFVFAGVGFAGLLIMQDLGNSSVETLGHAVGLWFIWCNEPVFNAPVLTDAVEGMTA